MRKNPASLASLRHSLPAWLVLFLVALLWSQRAYLYFLVPSAFATAGTATFGGTGGTGGNVYADIFYDHGNTAYFIDPNATGTSATMAGTLSIGNGGFLRTNYGPLNLQYKSALNAWTTGLTIQDTTGNVGIGTTSPASTHLQIYGGVGAGSMIITETGNDDSFIQLSNTFSSGRNWRLLSNPDGTFAIRDDTFGARIVTVTSNGAGSGNVGIGTTGPTNKLHVQAASSTTATAYVNNTSTDPYGTDDVGMRINMAQTASNPKFIEFFQNGSDFGRIQSCAGTGVCYNSSSDIRLKENITETSMGLDDILKIPVRDFNFKKDPNKTKLTGFIAQELEPIYPQAVTPSVGKDDYWQVDYSKLTPLLVKGEQDLLRKINEQQQQIDALKAEIESLKK